MEPGTASYRTAVGVDEVRAALGGQLFELAPIVPELRLFSHYGAKLYLDQVLAKKQLLRA